MTPSQEQKNTLELEMDLRLAELWHLVGDDVWFTREELATYMRAAWAFGYKAGYKAEIKPEWFSQLGYDLGEKA